MLICLVDECYINVAGMSINDKKAFLSVSFRFCISFKDLLKPNNPIALLDHPLLDTVKCAIESVLTSSTQVLIKSPDSPL